MKTRIFCFIYIYATRRYCSEATLAAHKTLLCSVHAPVGHARSGVATATAIASYAVGEAHSTRLHNDAGMNHAAIVVETINVRIGVTDGINVVLGVAKSIVLKFASYRTERNSAHRAIQLHALPVGHRERRRRLCADITCQCIGARRNADAVKHAPIAGGRAGSECGKYDDTIRKCGGIHDTA